ncbi:MAG: hypothetical protein R2851_05100 [Caldilineaceae bacterium]
MGGLRAAREAITAVADKRRFAASCLIYPQLVDLPCSTWARWRRYPTVAASWGQTVSGTRRGRTCAAHGCTGLAPLTRRCRVTDDLLIGVDLGTECGQGDALHRGGRGAGPRRPVALRRCRHRRARSGRVRGPQ